MAQVGVGAEMSGNIWLYRHDVESHRLVEKLKVDDLQVTNQSTIELRILSPPQKTELYLLSTDALIQGELLGQLDSYNWLYSPTTNLSWCWRLSPWELQRVEEMRGGYDLRLTLRGSGMGRILSEDPDQDILYPVPLRAHANFDIPASEWERILEKLGYEPAKWLSLPLESRHWPNWPQTVSRMQRARTTLARGETHQALEECLGVLEGLQSAPYDPSSWKGVFDVDPQKEEGLKELISGIGTYLNKVGHHHSREERNEEGNLKKSRVDQYEAETLVAMTQLLIAYLGRLPRQNSRG